MGSSTAIVSKQAMWVVIGLPLMWFASRLPAKAWRLFAHLGLVASVALLVLVVVAGTEVNGNKNWLDFGGPFRIQPSELAKLALVLWASDLLARKERLIGQWKHLLVPIVPVGGFILALVLLGGDLGTAIIIAAILAALLWVAGAPTRLFLLAAAPAALVFAYMVNTRSTRMSRITVWLHPDQADPLGNGMQALHGKFALASGGWWGVGLGGSKEKWGSLPAAHTDFIFAIIGEELGLAGTLVVLALFGLHRLCRPPRRTRGHRAVRPLRRRRRHRVGARAGAGQHRRRARPAAHHRRPAAARVVRRLGAGADDARPRDAAVVRAAARRPPAPAAVAARPTPAGRRRVAGQADRLVAAGVHGHRCRAPGADQVGGRRMHVVLAGGGSAGHIEPALALADALRRRDPAAEITALGTERGLDTRLVPARGYELALIPPVPLPRRPGADLLRVPGRLKAAVDAAADVLRRQSADVVVGFGGYVSGPAYLAARRLGVPIVVHEANARPGLANRLGARLTPTSRSPSRARRSRTAGSSGCRCAGPSRRSTGRPGAARRGRPSAWPPTCRRCSSPAGRRVRSGSTTRRPVRRPTCAPPACRCCTPPAPRTWSRCARAPTATRRTSRCRTWTGWSSATPPPTWCSAAPGANTVAELTAVGLPAAYVPLPIGNGEQALNARPVVEAGGGLMVDDAELHARTGSAPS